MQEITLKTSKRTELIDITAQIIKIVKQSEVKEGICVVYCPHTTAGLTINEHADPAVVEDVINWLMKLAPFGKDYAHLEGNTDAHLKSVLSGTVFS
jgi:secondary thiamine-phosphate synthase enzyme